MEEIFIVILLCLLVGHLSFRRGLKRGRGDGNFEFYKRGYLDGQINTEEEICAMKGLKDEEILKRVKSFIKNCKK